MGVFGGVLSCCFVGLSHSLFRYFDCDAWWAIVKGDGTVFVRVSDSCSYLLDDGLVVSGDSAFFLGGVFVF